VKNVAIPVYVFELTSRLFLGKEAVLLTACFIYLFIYLGFNCLLNLTCSHTWYFNVSVVSCWCRV